MFLLVIKILPKGSEYNMSELTCKELASIKEQLSAEKLLISKYNFYSEISEDTEVKAKCKDFASKHQKHYDKIFSYLK